MPRSVRDMMDRAQERGDFAGKAVPQGSESSSSSEDEDTRELREWVRPPWIKPYRTQPEVGEAAQYKVLHASPPTADHTTGADNDGWPAYPKENRPPRRSAYMTSRPPWTELFERAIEGNVKKWVLKKPIRITLYPRPDV